MTPEDLPILLDFLPQYLDLINHSRTIELVLLRPR